MENRKIFCIFADEVRNNIDKMEKKVKALMYNGVFVDAKRLGGGIYEAEIPSLYSIEDTISKLMEKHASILMAMKSPVLGAYLDDLSKCELVEVFIGETSKWGETKQ